MFIFGDNPRLVNRASAKTEKRVCRRLIVHVLVRLSVALIGVIIYLEPEWPCLAQEPALRRTDSISRSDIDASIYVQTGHGKGITASAFSSDGKLAATGSVDGTVLLWEIASERQIADFHVRTAELDIGVQSIAFSPDNKLLLIGAEGVTLWDIATRAKKRQFQGRFAQNPFRQNGNTIILLQGKSVVEISAETGVEVTRVMLQWGDHGKVNGLDMDIDAFAFYNQERYLITSSKFSGISRPVNVNPMPRVLLWDLVTGHMVREYLGHELTDNISQISSIVVCSELNIAMTGSADKTARIWDINSGQQLKVLAHDSQVDSIAFGNDCKLAYVGLRQGAIHVWDVNSGVQQNAVKFDEWSVSSITVARGRELVLSTSESGGEDKAQMNAKVWEGETGHLIGELKSLAEQVSAVSMSKNPKRLLVASRDGSTRVFSVERREQEQILRGHTAEISAAAISEDGQTVVTGSLDGTLQLWDTKMSATPKLIEKDVGNVFSVNFSSDGKMLIATTSFKDTFLYTLASGLKANMKVNVSLSKEQYTWPMAAVLSPNGKAIALVQTVFNGDSSVDQTVIEIRDATTLRKTARILCKGFVTAIAFGNDNSTILTGSEGGEVRLWNAQTGNQLRSLGSNVGNISAVAFDETDTKVAVGTEGGSIQLLSVENDHQVLNLIGHRNEISSIAFYPGNKILVSGSADATTRFWDVKSGTELASLISFTDGAMTYVTPGGEFDTTDIASSEAVSWIASDDPVRPLAPEIFMRDYYEPRLLPRLLACHEAETSGVDPGACAKAFKPVRPLAELNRIQPEVRIAKVERGWSVDEAQVEVKVSGKKDATQKNGKLETAAYDLRLFRDGQIVGQWPEPKGGMGGAEDIGQWQGESLVPGTENEGKATHTFKVKLAARDRGQPVKFTAYAFNEDRVKSETASDESYKVPEDVAQPKPRAYVIAIGVNAYDNPDWKLGFAVKDALDLSGALGSIEGYEVVSVPLVSGEKDGAKLDEATKQDIADTLALLGGHEEPRQRLRQAIGSVADQLRQATPDDLVILGFSGHGYADKQGRFYLLPSDSGKESAITDASLMKFVSSDELSQWLKDVDAGELAMIIDACHSAGSIPEGFKPGPMGDRGLGQLAYDKGMRILAATQADNVALESAELGQGLLTYALVDEGLKAHKAAPDGKGPITIGAWLRYAEQRVPQLYDDIQAGRIQAAKVVAANDASRTIAKEPIVDPAFKDQIAQHAQTPQLFDFYKLKGEAAIIEE
jgi:WD40 repeat protein/uncharacterized caspase-like protein